MTQADVIAQLQLVFDDVFLDKVTVTPQLTAQEVDEWDSLIHISLILAVEKRFKIHFGVGEVEAARNVGDLANLILKRHRRKRQCLRQRTLRYPASPSACALPLCVDLDGTLIPHRYSVGTPVLLLLQPQSAVRAFLLPVWLAGGRVNLKREISSRVGVDPTCLPYHEELLAFLREQHRAGRPLLLATASYRDAAEPIAAHLGIFSGVVATEGSRNLKGEEKRSFLVREYGAKGFDYAGNSSADLAVWKDCNRAIVVNASAGLCRKASTISTLERVFPRKSGWKALPRALRVHQWVKNVLVALPMLTSHQIFEPHLLLNAFLAFVAFSFCASSVYVLNDLPDLKSDRLHPRKRKTAVHSHREI